MSEKSSSRRMILGAILSLAPLQASAQFRLPKEANDFLNRGAGSSAVNGVAGSVPAGAALS